MAPHYKQVPPTLSCLGQSPCQNAPNYLHAFTWATARGECTAELTAPCKKQSSSPASEMSTSPPLASPPISTATPHRPSADGLTKLYWRLESIKDDFFFNLPPHTFWNFKQSVFRSLFSSQRPISYRQFQRRALSGVLLQADEFVLLFLKLTL